MEYASRSRHGGKSVAHPSVDALHRVGHGPLDRLRERDPSADPRNPSFRNLSPTTEVISHRQPSFATNMSDKHADILKRFQAFLEQEEKTSTPDDMNTVMRAAQTGFWREIQGFITVNDGSIGLEQLDNLAVALIDSQGRAATTLENPVLILPPPSSQTCSPGGGGQPHPAFAEVVSSQKWAAVGIPAKGSRKKKPRSTAGLVKTTKSGSGPSAGTRASAKLDLDLALNTPTDVRRSIDATYAKAAESKQQPHQPAYPWEGHALWYDPEEYPGLHVAHWRFWNTFRATLFERALHMPLATTSAQTQRRKRKMAAIRECLSFISLCIETWGYFNFLRRLEAEGNGGLMWRGRQAGWRTAEAKRYTCSPILDLMDLYENDRGEYHRKIREALDSLKTVPELLEKTDAIDPDLGDTTASGPITEVNDEDTEYCTTHAEEKAVADGNLATKKAGIRDSQSEGEDSDEEESVKRPSDGDEEES
ncbi:unnamed protein product [Phytophthora fragariaefolia]|uniref:Unnamed protein product n=1 Tax=Phytophthora fragariaefolia TaxID=1490495 RepID=A0A9W6Y0S1_9STRA|nr:unnamed protein product [Phytophthora fragariaefolia]